MSSTGVLSGAIAQASRSSPNSKFQSSPAIARCSLGQAASMAASKGDRGSQPWTPMGWNQCFIPPGLPVWPSTLHACTAAKQADPKRPCSVRCGVIVGTASPQD